MNLLSTKTYNPMYTPPFTISAEAINLIAEISGLIERYAIRLEQEDGLRLRKANRIFSAGRQECAIEGDGADLSFIPIAF